MLVELALLPMSLLTVLAVVSADEEVDELIWLALLLSELI